jgi:CRP-like cAMP-binding protein
VPTRVARTFLRLGDRFGQSIDDGAVASGVDRGSLRRRVRLTLPLTHETIANMVGAARETTTSTIEQMRRSGLVHGTRGRYVIDVDGLADYANEAAAAS